MVNDETLTVTYSAKVDYDKLTGRGKPEETKNIANVKSEETPEPKTVEKTVEIDFFRLIKTPGNHTLVPGSSTEYTHTWTLEINKEKLFTVGGKTYKFECGSATYFTYIYSLFFDRII